VTRAEGHVGHERPVGGPALIALTHDTQQPLQLSSDSHREPAPMAVN